MFTCLRILQAANPDGVDAVILAVNHVPRSASEVAAREILATQAAKEAKKGKDKAEAVLPQHYLVYLAVGELVYVDVVDADTGKEPAKADQVRVVWTKTTEGDGLPLLNAR